MRRFTCVYVYTWLLKYSAVHGEGTFPNTTARTLKTHKDPLKVLARTNMNMQISARSISCRHIAYESWCPYLQVYQRECAGVYRHPESPAHANSRWSFWKARWWRRYSWPNFETRRHSRTHLDSDQRASVGYYQDRVAWDKPRLRVRYTALIHTFMYLIQCVCVCVHVRVGSHTAAAI